MVVDVVVTGVVVVDAVVEAAVVVVVDAVVEGVVVVVDAGVEDVVVVVDAGVEDVVVVVDAGVEGVVVVVDAGVEGVNILNEEAGVKIDAVVDIVVGGKELAEDLEKVAVVVVAVEIVVNVMPEAVEVAGLWKPLCDPELSDEPRDVPLSELEDDSDLLLSSED